MSSPSSGRTTLKAPGVDWLLMKSRLMNFTPRTLSGAVFTTK